MKTQPTVRIGDIHIGERHRRDMGDIEGFARSIADLGILQPVGITPDGILVFGHRRLLAAQAAGLSEVPVVVVDLERIVEGEYAENAFHKAFTPSEMVSIAAAIEPIERERARERETVGHNQHTEASEKFSKGSTGRALDKVAKVAGIGRPTLAKARAVVEAAEADPERFSKLKEAMDKTGRVNNPYKRLVVARQADRIRAEPSPLPGRGPYRVAVVDFPWPYEIASEEATIRGVWPYPTMSVSEIRAFPITSIMHEDSILWVWTTNYHMQVIPDLVRSWGFRWVQILTWVKDRVGSGDWLRGQTEHCIMAVRGRPLVQLTNQSTRLDAPVRAHSQKPIEFYNLVESLCPSSRYCDVFSRYKHNERWDCHGDQAPPDSYDSDDDIRRSVEVGFEAIRERKANGGPGWGDDGSAQ